MFLSMRMTNRWMLVGFTAMLLAVTACTAAPASPGDNDLTPASTPGPPTPSPVPIDLSEFTEDEFAVALNITRPGRAILGYLACLDFDCYSASERLESLGSQPIPFLLYMLENGIPDMLGLSHVNPRLLHFNILSALGLSKDIRALEPLLALKDHPDRTVRSIVSSSLPGISQDDVVLSTLLVLLEDSDFFVRESTAKALGRLGRTDAIPAMREALKTEPSEDIRDEISKSIKRLEQR